MRPGHEVGAASACSPAQAAQRLLASALLLGAGCDARSEPAGEQTWRVIGGPGRHPGSFVTPRGLGIAGNKLWVVDRSGRAQAFTLGGELLAEVVVSEASRGFPVGVLAERDGGFLLCDTHASVLRRFDAEGAELGRLGSAGTGAGEFAYPQRATRDARSNLYVSELGEGASNRVQVFDEGGRFLRSMGGHGERDGGFTRAMGLVVLGSELYVSDVSDRIVVYSTDGEFLREFGQSGRDGGELRYPYGLAAHGDVLYVCEYGNHRIQRFRLDGTSGGFVGSAGRGALELLGPWDVACDEEGMLYVCDAGNHRVVSFDPREVTWQESRW